mgnify:CR=1 FL=1
MGGAGVSGSSRSYIKDIITPAEAEQLSSISGRQPLDIEPIERVVATMVDLYPAAGVTAQSYAVIEGKPDGHPWHVDTGDTNHMLWCALSASVLLTRPEDFTGGTFEFDEPFDQVASRHRYATIYTSDQVHRVLPHTGNRRVLLIFLGANNGE